MNEHGQVYFGTEDRPPPLEDVERLRNVLRESLADQEAATLKKLLREDDHAEGR